MTPFTSWLYSEGSPEKMVPALDAMVKVVASSPANGATCSMPGVPRMMSIACRTTASVRARLAPGGSCTTVMR